ncbi:sulfotransferase family 2 domain-containing protein [Pelagovum sp. HNIBRBA483]|uniref:sulfotransferase family 2 domain-containing protein n=1 Tax=Pelagovum sp. HNIBRBA483 TaxID=3233341 RepID=UPI0034A4F6CD
MISLQVDQFRALHARAADRLLPHPIVFHHIPKCGGTSVGRALRRRYLLSQAGLRTAASDAALALIGESEISAPLHPFREAILLYHLHCNTRAIAMHVGFSPRAYKAFSASYTFATVLREPVARFMSHLCWNASHPDATEGIRLQLPDFLETAQARRLGATMVAYLSGLPSETPPHHPDAIEAAIKNLERFDVIGDLDHMDAFHTSLSKRLGTRLKIGVENVRTGPAMPTAYQGAIADRIREICAPDIALWEAYQQRRAAPS